MDNTFDLNAWRNNPNSRGLSSTYQGGLTPNKPATWVNNVIGPQALPQSPGLRTIGSGVYNTTEPIGTDVMSHGPSYYRQPVPTMAHGGSVQHPKIKGMHPIHAAPHELDLLDWAQGKSIKRKFHKEDGETVERRLYPGIEAVVRNKHLMGRILEALAHHERMHEEQGPEHGMAAGGPVDESNGRFGDLEVAYVGPHTLNYFKKATPSLTYNPQDGAPEFYSFGDSLKSLAGTIGGAASNAWNTAKPYVGELGRAALPYASEALGGLASAELGPIGGTVVGGVANKLGNLALDKIAPTPKKPLAGLETLKDAGKDIYNSLKDRTVNNIGDLVPGKEGVQKGIDYAKKFGDEYAAANPLKPKVPPLRGRKGRMGAVPPPSAPPPSPRRPSMKASAPPLTPRGLKPNGGAMTPGSTPRKRYI